MAADTTKTKLSGYGKAILTSLGGVISGAVLMYLTPLVNTVIRPARPVANFSQEAYGLTVAFNNRSIGGVHGWWDFGDGSALEPFDPAKDIVTHTYPRVGNYNVKLSLQNILGEEVDRTVAVNLDNGAAGMQPSIEAFEVIPLRPDNNAPCTYRIVSKVKNADLVVWGIGDEPLKAEANHEPEKYVTFTEPGWYTVRLVAFQGKQTVEKSEVVMLSGYGDYTQPMATLKVSYEGMFVQQKKVNYQAAFQWDGSQESAVTTASQTFQAEQGFVVQSVQVAAPTRDDRAKVRDLKVETLPDRTRFRVSAEMLQPKVWLTSNSAAPPQFVAQVEATLEKRSKPLTKPAGALAHELKVPGETVIPMPPPPPGMDVQAKRMSIEIKEGNTMLWNGQGLPTGAQVQSKNRTLRVTALDLGNQIRIEIVEARPTTAARPN